MDIWIGLLGSVLIAGAAYDKKSLTASGAAAAIVVGTVLYSLGTAAWFGTLIAFFLSSSMLSKYKQKRKAAIESGYAKSGNRDAGQVLANGGLGMLLCIGGALFPHPVWWAAFVGVMAAVTADTWATEIGGLSRTAPRSILTGRKVAAGTSGGVTALGLLATSAGGLFIGGAAWVFGRLGSGAGLAAAGPHPLEMLLPLIAAGLAGGIAGSLADSVIGAKWQAMYRCRVCGREIERRTHCGAEAEPLRGWGWMTNDAVNVIGSLIGGAAAAGAAYLAGWL
ncbi:DUF92 domain-containing protein [Paenibacillus lutrae]|uniref:DUF92 domain-containing protein n=1 Tax=Paenibacillus lutrae TaxID=2078573 RepID=A0A7X3FFK4_9BACL|nr:DUF92 domain-containing protein [Paenibacillus lutrae]MVO98486.1 DUF92 domain-containing protein [Paenibacillus lutrae]